MRKLLLFPFLMLAMLSVFMVSAHAVESDVNENYANATDSWIINGKEFFCNYDDEDRLYVYDQETKKIEKISNEHIISFVPYGKSLYLMAYRDGSSALLRFDVDNRTVKALYTFDSVVTSLARRDNRIYAAIKAGIVEINTSDGTGELFISKNDIATLYFESNDRLIIVTTDGERRSFDFTRKKESLDTLSGGVVQLLGVNNYTPRLEAPETTNPYYTTLNPFHNAGYGMVPNGGNCTCYAWGRAYENLGSKPSLSTGNAGLWYGRNVVYPASSNAASPALGAVACWSSSGAGHVAVVEVIDGNTVITSESGWKNFYFKTVTRNTQNSNFSASSYYSFQGYIYVLGNDTHTTHTKGSFLFYEAAHPHYNYYKCSVCGTTFTDGTTNYISGCSSCHTHSYSDTVKSPTCTDGGYTTHTCSCGNTYMDSYVSPLGHNWDDGTVTEEPTPFQDGTVVYHCSRCGDSYTGTVPAWNVEGSCGDQLTWILLPSGSLGIYGEGRMYDYSSYQDTPWYKYHNKIDDVCIWTKSLENIGNHAFEHFDALEDVYFPTGVPNSLTSIGEYAFADTPKLRQFWFLESVETIGEGAFYKSGLTHVALPSNIKNIADNAFFSCLSLDELTIPNGVERIGDYAFGFCGSLTEVTIPDSVTEIGDFAFECCDVEIVNISSNVVTMSGNAFAGNNRMTAYHVEENNPQFTSVDGLLYTKDMKTLIHCPGGVESALVADGVQEIQNAAFYNPQSYANENTQGGGVPRIESVTLPTSINYIERAAFINNPNLTSVAFLGDAPEIEPSLFSNSEPFVACDKMTIYYYSWNKGWSTPTWQNYPAYPMEHIHDVTSFDAIEPTETEPGYTEYQVCSICGETIKESEAIPPLGPQYTYEIGQLSIRNTGGTELTAIPTGSFLVTIPITKQNDGEDAMVFLASYTARGQFNGLIYVAMKNVSLGGTVEVTLPVDNTMGDIASLKAFAVASFSNMSPLGPASVFPPT